MRLKKQNPLECLQCTFYTVVTHTLHNATLPYIVQYHNATMLYDLTILLFTILQYYNATMTLYSITLYYNKQGYTL